VIALLIDEFVSTAWSVAIAILPLAFLFLLFQIFLLKLPRRQVKDLLIGVVIAALGLFLFLFGIGIGFLPFGRAVGKALGEIDHVWLVVLVAVLLGFVTTWGEPAVRILAEQVENTSSGSIPSRMLLLAVCAGVAVWVGLGMLRIVFAIPLLYLLVPGYLLAIVLLWLSDRDFVAIAADAGGVATGPLANSFLLALALGAAGAIGGENIVVEGFGFIALIALAPIISVMMLGVAIRLKTRQPE